MLLKFIVVVVVAAILDFQRFKDAHAVVMGRLGHRPELLLLLWWYPATYEHIFSVLHGFQSD